MLRNKKGQQEMVGFILIVVLVMIGLMVFLVISVREPPRVENSLVVENLLGSVMRHTTECAIVYEPNYDDFEDLFKSCHFGDQCTNIGKSACEYLNESLRAVLGDMIASEASINSYGLGFFAKDEAGMTGFLQINEGNCSGSVKSAQRSIVSGSETLVIRAKICS
jgi:hypothetical protein